MNDNKIGTVLVSREDAKRICNNAIANVKLYRTERTEKSVVYWMNRFNRKGIIYHIRTIFGNRPKELTYEETIEKLNTLHEQYVYYYNYKSYVWGDTLENAESIFNCCDSNILEPLTIEINIWDDLLFVSKLKIEEIKEKAAKFHPESSD